MDLFLTQYDPSDLPGSSLDPMGFERGYLFLADKILPGLTNVADRPRYFSVLCGGAFLANVSPTDPPRTQYQRRLDCILRFERFWTLANVLATEKAGNEELTVSGIRGVTYAKAAVESLLKRNSNRVDAEFKLLSRQMPYGVVGIYGAVANGMRFLDRKTFALTPDLGERLAENFLEESKAPKALLKAARDGGDVPIAQLTEWGQRSHVSGGIFPFESKCLDDALNRDPVRSRMSVELQRTPFEGVADTEILRLTRMLPKLSAVAANKDLEETVALILAFEQCYRLVMVGFERLLWLCRNLPAASILPSDLASDPMLNLVRGELPAAADEFCHLLDGSQTELFRTEIHRLDDVRHFVERAAACTDNDSLADEIMRQHDDVQKGKFDRGRRKMPWLETTGNRISLTMTRVGGLNKEVTSAATIAPHPYRLNSADALISAVAVQ